MIKYPINRKKEGYSIMTVYEKIFARLEELQLSQTELSRRTGIATSTISDWRKKRINPQADKLVSICKALNMSLVDLLCNEEDKTIEVLTGEYIVDNRIIIENIMESSIETQTIVYKYLDQLLSKNTNELSAKPVSIIIDSEGEKVAIINDIRFKRSKRIDWNTVEDILKENIGKSVEIIDTNDMIYIGSDFPDEYAHSKDTKVLWGQNEYAKANASIAVKELIQTATNKVFSENYKDKHKNTAKYGWYRYDIKFAIPKYDNEGELAGYNIFKGRMVIRYASDNKLYIYDIIRIKKETSRPL